MAVLALFGNFSDNGILGFGGFVVGLIIGSVSAIDVGRTTNLNISLFITWFKASNKMSNNVKKLLLLYSIKYFHSVFQNDL